MKLKYDFVVREVGNSRVAVTVGADNAKFNGMVKLNETGALIFDMLRVDTTEKAIVAEIVGKYDVGEEEAAAAVKNYIETLRKNGIIED